MAKKVKKTKRIKEIERMIADAQKEKKEFTRRLAVLQPDFLKEQKDLEAKIAEAEIAIEELGEVVVTLEGSVPEEE